ncbi:MAG: type IV pilus secretin PilQ [Deltaproteobacteria bacterium]|nr:type IV pilus secretin PilQ [Deltaproteobacteria bacterium]
MSVLSKALGCVALLAVINGCAANSTLEGVNDSTAEVKGQSDVLASASPDLSKVLELHQIASASDAGVGLELERGVGFTRLIISTDEQQPQIDVSSVEEPARLVVDLLGKAIAENNAYSVENDDFLKAVRVGSHADRTRVVIDLARQANESAAEQSVETSEGRVIVTFVQDSANADVVSAGNSEQLAARPEADEKALASGSDIDAVAEGSIDKVDQVSSLVEQDAKPAAANLTVDSLQFAARDGSTDGKIVVALSDKAAYQLKKAAPTEYVLTIPGAMAVESTKVPQITTATTPGIRTARVVQEGSDAVVRMFVEAGVDLEAKSQGNTIEVAALPSADDKSKARAQLADDSKAKEAKDDKKSDGEPTAGAEALEDDIPGAATGVSGSDVTGVRSADGAKVYVGRLISLDLQDTDIDNALRIIAEVSNLNIIAADDVSGKVTLRLIDVPWDQALDVILKTNGLGQVVEGNVVRIAPIEKLRQEREALKQAKQALEELEDLSINYIRVSYARATDIQEQVETVLSERGTVSVDERTNQLIVKDIQKGQEAVMELASKLDLRTPQVLLETQIVESQRGILRDLGFQWNFSYAKSPETGNATGLNFPNSITSGGATGNVANPQAVNFPAVLTDAAGSAVSAVLDSADGSRMLSARLSALETEGKVRVISRPQVATVNNEEAEIKSVETVRVKLPNSGLSVATGAGATASGGGSSAFEEIDVGIELHVTPQASPDYYVLLDIFAKSSTFGDRIVDNIPSTLERQATSTILVKSGQTFALGGVYRIEDNDRIDGVPFLKDVPFLGHMFRRSLVDKGDEELIFFITPHIVEGSFDASLM